MKAQLEELENIAKWFESDNAFDLDMGIEKVKRASEIIKTLKVEFNNVENEFRVLRKQSFDELE